MPYPEVNMALAICCFLSQVAQCCPFAQNTQSLIAWPVAIHVGKTTNPEFKKGKKFSRCNFSCAKYSVWRNLSSWRQTEEDSSKFCKNVKLMFKLGLSKKLTGIHNIFYTEFQFPGLHNLFHPTIRDGSRWGKFGIGTRGEHGDVP